MMLNIFNGKTPLPYYRLVPSPDGKLQTITVMEEVKRTMGHSTRPQKLME